MSDQDELDGLLDAMPDSLKEHLPAQIRVELAEAVARLRTVIPDGHGIPQEYVEAFGSAMWQWFEAGWHAGAADAVAQAVEQGAKIEITGGPRA